MLLLIVSPWPLRETSVLVSWGQMVRFSAPETWCWSLYCYATVAMVTIPGAGKTTLISVLTGLYEPTQGTARIAGLDLLTQVIRPHSHSVLRPRFRSSYELCSCFRCLDVGHPSPPRGVPPVQHPISRAVGRRAPAILCQT